MMLSALYDLARREGLLDDPDFEKKRVDYFLRINDQGHFVALIPAGGEDGKGKEISVPRMPKRTVGVDSGFLFDNVKYVLGLGGDKPERNKLCFANFCRLVDEAARLTQDTGVMAFSRFLQNLPEQIAPLLRERALGEWDGSEWIAPVLASDGMLPLYERPSIRSYWSSRRNKSSSNDETSMRCIVTGQVGPITRLHGSVKRVPETSSMGASLVSFNAESFCSHGLEQGENAAVSRSASEGYVTALNWLLQADQGRRFRYGVSLEDDVVLFWTREANDTADVLVQLFGGGGDPKEAIAVAEAAWRGIKPSASDTTPFYAVTLGGNVSRVVVRDWLETTAGEVKKNVRRYFEDLQIGTDTTTPLPLWMLLAALRAPGEKETRPELKTRLFRASVLGTPLPRVVLSAALRRLRLPPDAHNERSSLHLRCALIKAYLLRTPRSSSSQEVTVSLDESNSSPAYQLGRLFAVLERLQTAALGDLNATIRDRYFGSACANPALVFPRLLRLSVHHAAKAEQGGWLERLKGSIVAKLPAERMPNLLPLEDQGLFAIGYYHQREAFYQKKSADNVQSVGSKGVSNAVSNSKPESIGGDL